MSIQGSLFALGVAILSTGIGIYFSGNPVWGLRLILISLAFIVVLLAQRVLDPPERPLRAPLRSNFAPDEWEGRIAQIPERKPQYFIRAGARLHIGSPEDLNDLRTKGVIWGDQVEPKKRELKGVSTVPRDGAVLQEQYSDDKWIIVGGMPWPCQYECSALIVPRGAISRITDRGGRRR